MKTQKDVLMADVMSANQINPAAAKPEDFKVYGHEDAESEFKYEFGGQCGDTKAEYNSLLKVREAGRSKEGNTEKASELSSVAYSGSRKRK